MKSAAFVSLSVTVTTKAANGGAVVAKRGKLRNEAKRLLGINGLHFWLRKTKPKKATGPRSGGASPGWRRP